MGLKSRVNHLSRGRVQTLIINSHPVDPPVPGVAVLPETSRYEWETRKPGMPALRSVGGVCFLMRR